MSKVRASVVGMILCSCLLLNGCSKDNLTLEMARPLIEKRLARKPKSLFVQIGRGGAHCYTATVGGKSVEVNLDPNKSIHSTVAKKAGYITWAPDGADFWKTTLTPQGQAFLDAEKKPSYGKNTNLGCDTVNYALPLAKPVLLEVAGITGDDKSPEVRYTWKWEVTALGAMLRENGSVYQQLTPQEKTDLSNLLTNPSIGAALKLPVPEDQTPPVGTSASVKFTKSTDGWRIAEPD